MTPPRAAAIEFDGRYRFPYRVIETVRGNRLLYSRHKTRAAAEASLKKREKAEAHFEANKDRLITP